MIGSSMKNDKTKHGFRNVADPGAVRTDLKINK